MKRQKTRNKPTAKKVDPTRKKAIMLSIKGAIYALILTVICVLALALAVKQLGLADSAISTINQIIKIGSILIGALVACKLEGKFGVAAAAMAGALYVVLGYLTFSLIEGSVGDIGLLFADLVMAVIIAALCAMIKNLLSRKRT